LGRVQIEYVGEGMNSSIAISKLGDNGATQFHVAGKVEASSLPQDMRLQRMLGHLPALVHPNPKSVLIVGFGAGVTSGSFVPYPSIQRIVICELEPLIPEKISTYFTVENNNVKNDPRTEIFYDDARSFIITTKEKFDIITSDPIHPWVKGAASLYTKEYFEAVKEHLNPGGVVTQWVPLYETNLEAVKSEVATFLQVFPQGTVWANNVDGKGYDVVLLAGRGAITIEIGLTGRGGFQFIAGALFDLRRTSVRLDGLGGRRRNQSGPKSATAISGRHRVERVSGRRNLQQHDYGSEISVDVVCGERSVEGGAAEPARHQSMSNT